MLKLAPFLLQGAVLIVDELYCHRGRVLRRWERWGHPLDTFFFGICFLLLAVSLPSEATLYIYGGFAIVSCLLVSKDEWEHRELCSGFENWLHSLLFLLHPTVLIWAGYLWWSGQAGTMPVVVCTASLALFLYQVVYWNVWRRD